MKKIYRLTETDLRNIITHSVNKLLHEDVLGNNWNSVDAFADEVADDNSDEVYNNYEPFENQHDWGVQGERPTDPTEYDPNNLNGENL